MSGVTVIIAAYNCEGFVTRAGENDDPNRIVGAQFIKDRSAFGARLNVQRVSLFRAIDSDDGDASASLNQNSLVALTHFTGSTLYFGKKK